MFSNLKRVAVAAATAGAIALVGASGASASFATSFHVGSEANRLNQTGSMALSASAGASRLVVNGSIKLECATTGATGTINTGVYSWTGATNGTQNVGTVQPTYSSCTGPLGLAFTVVCANTSPLGATDIPTNTAFAGTVGGEITSISCVVTFVATGCTANITGSVPGSYTNPVTPSTNGKLTVFTAGQALTVSGSGCPAIVPNGTAQYGAPSGSGLGLANIDYTVGGAIADQPYFTPTY